ncbi:MAG: hypothetical protein WBQ26_12640, partial [Gemmatimonadaceae bacterium]
MQLIVGNLPKCSGFRFQLVANCAIICKRLHLFRETNPIEAWTTLPATTRPPATRTAAVASRLRRSLLREEFTMTDHTMHGRIEGLLREAGRARHQVRAT